MKKKEYATPSMKVVTLPQRHSLLAGSVQRNMNIYDDDDDAEEEDIL